MRAIAAEITDAYAERGLKQRLLVWITAKDRVTGDLESIGFSNAAKTATFSVLAGLTLIPVDRVYIGAGGLIDVGRIPLTSDVSVRELEITFSQIDESVAIAVRGYDARNAAIEVHEAIYDPATHNLVASAEPLFVGYVDRLNINTPAEGQEGSITLSCVSQTRELTRGNTDVRSDESQKLRSATDNFFVDVGTVGEWQIDWGSVSAPLAKVRKKEAA